MAKRKTKAEKLKEELEQQTQANEAAAALITRQGDEAVEAADEDLGVGEMFDFDFATYDPHDIVPYLKRAGIEHEPEKFRYKWINVRHKPTLDRRLAQGWQLIPKVTKGDMSGARIPHAVKERTIDRRIEARKRAFKGNEDQFDNDVRNPGVSSPITGHHSRREGM